MLKSVFAEEVFNVPMLEISARFSSDLSPMIKNPVFVQILVPEHEMVSCGSKPFGSIC